MKEELKKIFKKYRKKYKLKTSITFMGQECHICYSPSYDRINIDLDWIKEIQDYFGEDTIYVSEATKYQTKDIKEITIFTLLHEIKHAIDYSRHKLKFIKDWMDEKDNLEKRADRFARKELRKVGL